MTQELKLEIIQAATAYMGDKVLSANELSKISGINPAYLSNMLRSIFHINISGKDVEIQDRWFKKLATAIDFRLDNVRWETIPTGQFIEGVSYLETAKNNNLCGILIGDTGAGKSYLINRFCISSPSHTYRVTVSSLHALTDILDDLAEMVGISTRLRTKQKLDAIIRQLVKAKQAGEDIIIIIDEAENLRVDVIRMLKALYDKLSEHCSIILVGTPELIKKLEDLNSRGHYGIPQFYRRFKAGIRYLDPVNKSFAAFFEKHVDDKELRKLLTQLSDNYGELHDWLYPVMVEAKEQKKPLTAELFRLHYNMPVTGLSK